MTTIANIQAKPEKKVYGLSRSARILRTLSFIVPVIILSLLVIISIFAPLLAPYDPVKQNMLDRRAPPVFMEGGSSEHILGTDHLGRDILSRLVYGGRVSLTVSLLVIFITAAVGTIIGITSGYFGGRIDGFLMRMTDVALSFPPLLIAMLLSVGVGPGFFTVVFALSILGWSGYSRLVRGETLRLRNSDFVAQARVNGASDLRIMIKHIFPNILNSLIVVMTLAVGMMILAEAMLSYLGIGIPAPTPSWGSMVSDGRNDLDRAWWIATIPGIAIGLVVMSGNFLGDWLRDKLDPRLRQV